jgi:hypothetical protein
LKLPSHPVSNPAAVVFDSDGDVCLPSEDVPDEANGAKGNKEVVQLHVRDHGQKVGRESQVRANGMEPDSCSKKSSDEVEDHNHQNTLNWPREGAQVKRASVILLPGAQVKVCKG